MNKPKKDQSVLEKEVEKVDEAKVVAPSSPTSDYKPFIEIIEEPQLTRNVLEVMDKNPRYAYQWCPKNEMAGNRYSFWLVMDKTHPDFKDIRVHIDHSPDQTCITYGDLILCVCMAETFEAWQKMANEDAKHSGDKVKKEYENKIEEERSNLARKKDLKVL